MRSDVFVIALVLLLGLVGCDTQPAAPTPTSTAVKPTATTATIEPTSTAVAGEPTPTATLAASLGLRNLRVSLGGMTPHVGQLVELRVVADGDQIQARALLDPLTSAKVDVLMPLAVPAGSHRLDFFADLSTNGKYDLPPADHAWRVTPIESKGALTVDFTHNVDFTDINEPVPTDLGGDFRLNLTGFTPHVGQLFEVRVIKEKSGQTVGLYRLGEIPKAAFQVSIPGVIEDGTQYNIDLFADLSGNGQYDAPPADHAWRMTATGTADGLTVNFAHNVNFTDVGF